MKENCKIIIHNYTELNDLDVMKFVSAVMSEGLISIKNNTPQYCFLTTFENKYVVTCAKNKTGYTFKLYKEDE